MGRTYRWWWEGAIDDLLTIRMTIRSHPTFEDFLDDYELWRRHDEAKNERPGQSWFNMLARGWPEWADEIRGTIYDPYYDDRRVDRFLGWVHDKFEATR